MHVTDVIEIQLSGGYRVRIGGGVKAAALMGQLRTALRSYAVEGHSPGQTLELSDRFVQSMGEYAMAKQIRAILVNEQEHQIDLATALGKNVSEVASAQEQA